MNKSEIISICKKSDTLTKNQYLALYQIILHGDSLEKSDIADLLINHVNKKLYIYCQFLATTMTL